MNVDFSIVIPVYNVEAYLRQCLDSLFVDNADVFEKHSVEVICVNDASPDGSAAILEEYAARYSQLRVVTNSVNKGLSGSRNVGMDLACGQWIYFIDSDDFIAPGALEEPFAMAKAHPNSLVCVDVYCYMEEDPADDTHHFAFGFVFHGGSGVDSLRALINICGTRAMVYCYVFPLGLLRSKGIRFADGYIFEDNAFSFAALLNAEAVFSVNKPTYMYRRRISGSISVEERDYRHLAGFLRASKDIYNYYNQYATTHEITAENDAALKTFLRQFEYYVTLEFGDEVKPLLELMRS